MSKRDSGRKGQVLELEGRRTTMSGSAIPVIAQIVETMPIKIITSQTNVGELRREKLGFRLPKECNQGCDGKGVKHFC